jgi:hypothetical protein
VARLLARPTRTIVNTLAQPVVIFPDGNRSRVTVITPPTVHAQLSRAGLPTACVEMPGRAATWQPGRLHQLARAPAASILLACVTR